MKTKVQTHLYPVVKCLQIIPQEKLQEFFKTFQKHQVAKYHGYGHNNERGLNAYDSGYE